MQSVQTVDELSKIVQSVRSGSCKAGGSNEQATPPGEEEQSVSGYFKVFFSISAYFRAFWGILG